MGSSGVTLSLAGEPHTNDQCASLDPLPEVLQREVLGHVRFSARAACKAFRSQQDAVCTALRLRWPALPVTEAAASKAWHLQELRSLLVRMPQLKTLEAAGCPRHLMCAVAELSSLTLLELNETVSLVDVNSSLKACISLVHLNMSDAEEHRIPEAMHETHRA